MRLALFCSLMVSVVACGDDGGTVGDLGLTCATDVDCDDGVYCNGIETCADDGACVAGSEPCDVGRCDEATESCTGPCVDADGDGAADVACGGADCDDADPDRYPGNTEVCDAEDRDEDCDPTTFGFRDQDMDGVPDGTCCNGDVCGRDCDDTDPAVGMVALETCDGRDNDCDGSIDEELGGDELCNGADEDCDGRVDEGLAITTYHRDLDGDGYGDPAMSMDGCEPPDGWVANAEDCDDRDGDVRPDQEMFFEEASVGGIFDYNCDGTEETDYPVKDCTCSDGCAFSGRSYASGQTLECGELATQIWSCINLCGMGSCNPSTAFTAVLCR